MNQRGVTLLASSIDQWQVIETSDGRIHVSIPIALKRRSGRKIIALPQRGQPPKRPWDTSMTPLQKALVRAYRWLTMLERGEVTSLTKLAKQVGVNRSYVGRMLNLTTLAPDIVAAILDDQVPPYLKLLSLAINPPILWAEQRCQFNFSTPKI